MKTKKQLIEELEVLRKETEARLNKEQLYRLLAENTYDMITRHLPDSTYLYVSPACRTMFGYEPEELIGTKSFDQIHPGDVKRIIAITQAAVRTGGLQTAHYRHRRKDGQYIWVETVGKVIKNEKTGAIEDIVCNVRDITDRKSAEDAALKIKQDWENIFQAIGHPTIILDAQHNILSVNKATVKAAGAGSAEELTGRKCYEIFHRAGEPPEGCPLVRMLASAKLEESEMEVEAFGGIYIVSCTPVFDEKGDLQKIIHIATDISERKRAEEALRKEKTFSETMINSLPGIFCLFDENGHFLQWNSNFESVSGYSSEEMGKMNPLDFFAGDDKKLVEASIQEVFVKGESHVEAAFISKDGQKTPHYFTGLRFISDNRPYLIGMGIDITERKRAEEKIIMLSSMVEQSTEGMAIADLNGNLIFVNEAWRSMHGHKSAKELIGRNLAISHNQEQLENEVEPFNKKVIELGAYSGEVGHVTRDGKPFITFMVTTLLKDRQGKPYAFAAMAQDVTELKKAEKALQKSEAHLKLQIERMPIGCIIWDPEFRVMYWNPAAENIFGFTVSDAIGKHPNNIIVPRDAQPHVDNIWHRLLQGDATAHSENENITKDGRIITCYWTNTPLKETDGSIIGVLSMVQDITERKQAEDEIRKLNAELEQRVLERTSQLKAINIELGNEITERAQRETKIKRQNVLLEGINWIVREALTIETEEDLSTQCLAIAEELTGSRFGFIDELNEAGTMDSMALSDPGCEVCRMPHTDAAILLKNIPVRGIYAEAVKKGISVIVNDPGSHPDRVGVPEGHPQITAFLGVPLKQEGKVIGLIGLANKESGYDQDDQQAIEMVSVAFVEALSRIRSENLITTLNKELQQGMDALSHANKELEAFSYSVSHDLRSPLRAIDGFTEILLREYSTKLDDEGKRICSIITGNSRKMGQLIDELLSLSRLGRAEMHFTPIDMNALAISVYDELTTPELRLRIDFHSDDLRKAHGDPILMKQVWVNLVSNAIKFSSHRERPAISVTCRDEADHLVYCVKDNGAGFNMHYAGKLFGVFQRLHSDRDFEGTGVGLALVQRIIHRHGGKIWADGEVDKGATFCFSIPREEGNSE